MHECRSKCRGEVWVVRCQHAYGHECATWVCASVHHTHTCAHMCSCTRMHACAYLPACKHMCFMHVHICTAGQGIVCHCTAGQGIACHCTAGQGIALHYTPGGRGRVVRDECVVQLSPHRADASRHDSHVLVPALPKPLSKCSTTN